METVLQARQLSQQHVTRMAGNKNSVILRKYRWCHLSYLICFNNILGFLLYKQVQFRYDFQLGSVAGPVIQATGRLESEDGLRTGVLLHMGSR